MAGNARSLPGRPSPVRIHIRCLVIRFRRPGSGRCPGVRCPLPSGPAVRFCRRVSGRRVSGPRVSGRPVSSIQGPGSGRPPCRVRLARIRPALVLDHVGVAGNSMTGAGPGQRGRPPRLRDPGRRPESGLDAATLTEVVRKGSGGVSAPDLAGRARPEAAVEPDRMTDEEGKTGARVARPLQAGLTVCLLTVGLDWMPRLRCVVVVKLAAGVDRPRKADELDREERRAAPARPRHAASATSSALAALWPARMVVGATGFEPVTSSVSVNAGLPLCNPAFLQVVADRRGQS
jgi:hypothetical protein